VRIYEELMEIWLNEVCDRSRVTPEWKGVDNKSGGTTLASAHVLCLNLLSCVWLHISEGQNLLPGVLERSGID